MSNSLRNKITLGMFVVVLLMGLASAGTISQCVSKFDKITIATPLDGLAIKDPIPLITIQLVQANVQPDLAYIAELFKGTIEGVDVGDIVRGRLSNNGTAILNFNYEPQTTGDLAIRIRACGDTNVEVAQCDPSDLLEEIKIVEVKKTFDLKLFCNIASSFVNEEVTCTWTPTDVLTNQVIPINTPRATVTQGEDVLITEIKGNSLTFTPLFVGSAAVSVEATATDYLKDIDEITVIIQDVTLTQTFEIDSRDFGTFTETGIDVGIRSLTLKIAEGSQISDVRRIVAEITTPSGQVVPLTFTESGDIWRSSYNFESPGRKYILSGDIEFTDSALQPLPFRYSILTLAAQSERSRSIITNLIIWGSVALVVTIGTIIFFSVRRGRKKRKNG